MGVRWIVSSGGYTWKTVICTELLSKGSLEIESVQFKTLEGLVRTGGLEGDFNDMPPLIQHCLYP